MFRDILIAAAAVIASRPDPAAAKAEPARSRKTRRAQKYPRTASAAEREVLLHALNEIAEHIDEGFVALEGTNDDWAAYEAEITDKPSVSPDSAPTRFTVWRRIAPEAHREAVGEHNVQVHYSTDKIGSEHVRRISVSIYRNGASTALIDGYSPSRENVRRLPKNKRHKSGKLLNEVLRLAIKVFLRTDRGDLRALPLFLKNLRTWIRQRKRIRVVVTGTSISIFLGACYLGYYYASHSLQLAVASYVMEGQRVVSIIRWKPNGITGPYRVIKNGAVIGETMQTYYIDTSPTRITPTSTSETLYRVSGRIAGIPRVSLPWSADDRVKKSEPCIVDGQPDLCAPMIDLAKVIAWPFDRFAATPPIVAIVGRPIVISVVVNMLHDRNGEKVAIDEDRNGLQLRKPIALPINGPGSVVANGDRLEKEVTFDEPGLFPLELRMLPSNRTVFHRLVRVYSEAEILRDAKLIVDNRGEAAYASAEAIPVTVWAAQDGAVPTGTRRTPFSPRIDISRRSRSDAVHVSLVSPSGNEVLIDYGDDSGLQRADARTYVSTLAPIFRVGCLGAASTATVRPSISAEEPSRLAAGYMSVISSPVREGSFALSEDA